MKLSLKQLKRCVAQLEVETMNGSGSEDVIVELNIAEGDPGSGRLMTTLTMSCDGSDTHNEKNALISVNAKIELFEKHEKMDPIVSVSVVKKMTTVR